MTNAALAIPGSMTAGVSQRTEFDCLRAAIATAVGVPYEEAPDTEPRGQGKVAELRLWGQLHEWAHGRGLRVRFHDSPPVHCEAWIGVSPLGEDGYRHTIVLAHDRLLFDPAAGYDAPEGYRVAPTTQLEYGISFEEKEAG